MLALRRDPQEGSLVLGLELGIDRILPFGRTGRMADGQNNSNRSQYS